MLVDSESAVQYARTGMRLRSRSQQEMIEHGEECSVNVCLEVADVTRPLVAVGKLQRRGMAVVIEPHGSFLTRGRVAKTTGRQPGA